MSVSWVHWNGPLGLTIKAMSRYYAAPWIEAEDLAQEAWMAVHARPGKPPRLVAWTAVTNAAQKAAVLARYERACAERGPILRREPNPDDRLDVEVYLGRLADETDRTLVELVYLQEIDTAEAGRRVGLSRSAVNRRLVRALDVMRCA